MLMFGDRKKLFVKFAFCLRENEDVELKKIERGSTLCLQFKTPWPGPTTEMRFLHEISLSSSVSNADEGGT